MATAPSAPTNGTAGADASSTRPRSDARAGASGGNAGVRTADATPPGGAAGASGAPASATTSTAGSPAPGSAGAAASAGSGGGVPNNISEAGASGEQDPPAPTEGAADPDCDLTGVWIARQITVSEAIGVSAFSNNWYYLELKQSGTSAEVTKHFDCGIEIVGAVTVVLPRSALEAQLTHNLQAGRKLSMSKEGASCHLESQRFWSIRGADELSYLPGGVRDSDASIRELVTSLPLPTANMTQGAIDPDGDGKLGLAFEITGLLSGTRNSVQRDWTRWFSDPSHEFPAGSDWTSDINIRADFDNEESVLDPQDGLLSSGSTPSAGAMHSLRLRFLGRTATDARVAAIEKASQVDTCYAIQDALPAEELQ